MSGTAVAMDGPLPGVNQVGSDDIIDGEVKPVDITHGGVRSPHVLDDTEPNGGLNAQDLNSGSVRTSEVTNGSLTGNDVRDQSLTGSDIEDNSINADDVFGLRGFDDIENGSLTSADVMNQSLTGTDIQDNSINADDVFGLRGFDDIEDGSLTSADLMNGTIRGEDVATNTLTGDDIDESTLDLCQRGRILGYALIRGTSSIPNADFTDSDDFIFESYNCTGGRVMVRDLQAVHDADGVYAVWWEGVNWRVGVTALSADSINSDVVESDKDNFIQIAHIAGTGKNNDMLVRIIDDDGGGEHSVFYVAVM